MEDEPNLKPLHQGERQALKQNTKYKKGSASGKAPLEQVFENKTARVLDHLVTMSPFDYSQGELSEILGIGMIQINNILNHLDKFGLLQMTKNNKIRLADNNTTLAFKKVCYEIAIHNIDQIVEKQDR